jgi:hypothetical protein
MRHPGQVDPGAEDKHFKHSIIVALAVSPILWRNHV